MTAKPCQVPPPRWSCSREAGHDGPCAARPAGAYDPRAAAREVWPAHPAPQEILEHALTRAYQAGLEDAARIADDASKTDAEAATLSASPLSGKMKYGAARSALVAKRIRALVKP